MRGIARLTKVLLPPQEGLRSVELGSVEELSAMQSDTVWPGCGNSLPVIVAQSDMIKSLYSAGETRTRK
jgi:hypothetical protein